jgi:hypothetical protein
MNLTIIDIHCNVNIISLVVMLSVSLKISSFVYMSCDVKYPSILLLSLLWKFVLLKW